MCGIIYNLPFQKNKIKYQIKNFFDMVPTQMSPRSQQHGR